MALQGCCCCGLRGGAKAIGVFFLVVTLLQLVSVIAAWVMLTAWPTHSTGVGINTPDGRFGVGVRETQSILGGSGGDFTLDLGSFGGSISSSGDISLRTPKGSFSSGDLPSAITGRPNRGPSKETYLIPSTVHVLLSLLFNSMLVHGADHDSSCAVLAWLVYYGAMFVLTTLATLGALIACAVLTSASNVAASSLGIACGAAGGFGVLISALLWYWWAVVLAFERQVRAGTAGYKYVREVTLQEPPHAPRAAKQESQARV